MSFNIKNYVDFDSRGRAVCPSCASEGKTTKKNLSLVSADGAYKCHRGCTPADIREALGNPKDQVVPTAIARTNVAPKPVTVSPQKIREAHERLLNSNGPAKAWLHQRGITDEIITRYQLGVVRAKSGDRHLPAISIPLPNADGTAYYQKKRVAPWLSKEEQPDGYQPWSQAGIPARVWITHYSQSATQTWLCEGEWDAMMLSWAVRHSELENDIQVACFTCGCGNVPTQDQLDLLVGKVVIFYDRNDTPLKNGKIPGDEGAKKVALALGDRARIGLVPMTDGCEIPGWDVSNALSVGFNISDFAKAAAEAAPYSPEQIDSRRNPLRSRLVTTDDLVARAPEYVEWLVPDLLTSNELFGLASPPRGGKSLWCMLLSRSIATGENFLERPVTQGSVIYVNLEDSEAKIRERVEAQQWSKGLPIYWIDRFKLNEIDYLIEIADEIEDLRLIILDTFSRIRSDDKSESSAEMSFVLEPLQEFAKSRNVCILLVHHTTKLQPDKTTLDEIFDTLRGSTAIRGTCRGLLVIAPGDNCYRLCAENGWGKHDLKIRLDTTRLEWKLLGKWAPIVNQDQKEVVLDYLNRVGSATIDTIAEQTGLPKRSLYTVLDRLRADAMVEKIGSRKAATYQRPIQPIQLLNSLLNSPKPEPVCDTDAIQQKNKIFFTGDQRESDHPKNSDSQASNSKKVDNSSLKGDHLHNPLQKVINAENKVAEGDSAFCITRITEPRNADEKEVLENDHFRNSTGESVFVELGDQQGVKADGESVSAIQQQFNSNSTVELEKDACIEIFTEHGWMKGTYLKPANGSYFSHFTKKLNSSHWVKLNDNRVKVAESDIRRVNHADGA